MPGLARKVVICAAVDGLILQPLGSKKEQRSLPLVQIKYGDASISAIPTDAAPDSSKPNSSFEAFGIVGLVSVFHYNYLISITRRQQVAQIRGLPIYVVTEVALTPCSSQQDASDAIAKTSVALSTRAADQATDDSSSDDEAPPESGGNDEVGDDVPDPAAASQWSTKVSPNTTARSSIAEDVISRRGSYGRFAQRWFSRSGWAMDQKRIMGLSPEQAVVVEPGPEGNKNKGAAKSVPKSFPLPSEAVGSQAGIGLLPKLLRATQILFGSSRTFYYSYDYDITRSLANVKVPATALVPLHSHADPLYFWNRNIMRPFIDAGMDALALPLMQGFVGQRSFVVDSQPPQVDSDAKDSVEMSNFGSSKDGSDRSSSPSPAKNTVDLRPSEKKFDITVISRRSTKRAGLRYLRRGIDEQGNVANSVESEQILSAADATWDPAAKVYSFVQVRGSFPLFFTQSPYSLKPAAVLQHSPDANFAALTKHFEGLQKRYGALQIVNLVEKHGVEAVIGEQYERNIQRLNEESGSDAEKVAFEWFDFHAVCRGMKFEKVSLLLQILGSKLESFGSTVSVDDQVTSKQAGVLRTNCMDCLDRTNVCQSSFAKYMLDVQLKEQGFDMSLQRDQENVWFNTLWADNGDSISKQYASTGAMKGDYTRTRKRNYRGALTDAGLSLTRLFNGMFNDFFVQTTIDFLLGNVTSFVFEEFEANMMTKDPAMSMQKMREQAIELCQKRVVADESEELVGGWTLLTPQVPDTVRAASLEEAVLLLTDVALYLCRFDWNLDKVSSFERVSLAHIQKIKFGTYITSTISPAHVDEMRNVGLVIEYKPGSTDITRVNTRSLSSNPGKAPGSDVNAEVANRPNTSSGPAGAIAGFLSRRPQATPPRKIALKALYSQTSVADPTATKLPNEPGAITRLTEIQQVVVIAAEIERLALLSQPRLAGKKPEDAGLIEKGDIISLAEAKRNTGLLEQLGHSIKKLVWA
ncbi:SacI homology domain-containing protein [Lasiosphaeria miniovina]|uniref:SacI homology domain-containing protein n=1 Tax=Lasiosphaeria miniovina TaxID=1954250 RepID=A0AA40B694_9PEZI|nr:inositol 5'-phosphatase [Lasiosphaeria miniovina]KAK0728398.1 SacI homology domain-containing protein [Lasiosphaeria miniovina]